MGYAAHDQRYWTRILRLPRVARSTNRMPFAACWKASTSRCSATINNHLQLCQVTNRPLGDLVRHTKNFLSGRALPMRIPLARFAPAASVAQYFLGASVTSTPVRVRKANVEHIVSFGSLGFEFRYPFMKSLEHWRALLPGLWRLKLWIPCAGYALARPIPAREISCS